MVGRIRAQLAESLRAFRGVFHNPSLRRLQLAFAGSEIGDWGAAIALSVIAFQESGAAGVAVLLLIRMLPSAVAAPLTSILGDRHDRALVMLTADLIRAAAMAGAAVVAFTDGPVAVLYTIAGIVAVVATAFRPAQAAILPSLSRTPDELTAANVASSTIESAASFVGPAVGGVVLATAGAGVSFAVAAGTFLWSAALISRIRAEREQAERAPVDEHVFRTVTAGIRTILLEPTVRLLTGLFAAQTLVSGALNVLVVVIALDLLGTGESGLGALNAALGIGGVIGAAGAITLVGRRRLATAFGVGTVLWGVPIALIAVTERQAPVLVLLGVVGLANTVVDVAGYTLLQRAVPDDVLARVFGALESVFLGTIALGGVLASVLVETVNAETALVVSGLVLPVLVVLTWRPLVRIDAESPAPAAELLALLRGVPFLAPLSPPALEELASSLLPVRVAAGTDVFRQGDAGDRFYVIEAGEALVSIDGAAVRTQGPGDYFGEIALLRDVPRTASITAVTDLSLHALERDEFIAAVTGHARSVEAAGAIVASRLGAFRPGTGPL